VGWRALCLPEFLGEAADGGEDYLICQMLIASEVWGLRSRQGWGWMCERVGRND